MIGKPLGQIAIPSTIVLKSMHKYKPRFWLLTSLEVDLSTVDVPGLLKLMLLRLYEPPVYYFDSTCSISGECLVLLLGDTTLTHGFDSDDTSSFLGVLAFHFLKTLLYVLLEVDALLISWTSVDQSHLIEDILQLVRGDNPFIKLVNFNAKVLWNLLWLWFDRTLISLHELLGFLQQLVPLLIRQTTRVYVHVVLDVLQQ